MTEKIPAWKQITFGKLQLQFAGVKRNSAGFARGNCDNCYDKLGTRDTRASLGFNEDMGVAKCFRCGYRFVLDFGSMTTFVRAPENKRGFKMPTDLHYVLNSTHPVASKIRAYLWTRDVTDLEIAMCRVMYATSGTCVGRAVFPHWHGESDEIWGFSARAVPGMGASGSKVMYPPGMNRDQVYNQCELETDTDTPIMVVEGVIDSCLYLPNAVACLGKPGKTFFNLVLEIYKKQGRIRPIVFCLDGDAVNLSRMMSRRLARRGVRSGFVHMPAGMDPNTVNPDWLRLEVARIGDELCIPTHPSTATT
jgi:hypothetical protein